MHLWDIHSAPVPINKALSGSIRMRGRAYNDKPMKSTQPPLPFVHIAEKAQSDGGVFGQSAPEFIVIDQWPCQLSPFPRHPVFRGSIHTPPPPPDIENPAAPNKHKTTSNSIPGPAPKMKPTVPPPPPIRGMFKGRGGGGASLESAVAGLVYWEGRMQVNKALHTRPSWLPPPAPLVPPPPNVRPAPPHEGGGGHQVTVPTPWGRGGLHHTMVALQLQQFQYNNPKKSVFGAWYFLCFCQSDGPPPLGGGGGCRWGGDAYAAMFGSSSDTLILFCSGSRVPRKCSARPTGAVWQKTYNIHYPMRRTHVPSHDGGMYN